LIFPSKTPINPYAFEVISKMTKTVSPAEAGVQNRLEGLDSGESRTPIRDSPERQETMVENIFESINLYSTGQKINDAAGP
jgi:hypothetical protein